MEEVTTQLHDVSEVAKREIASGKKIEQSHMFPLRSVLFYRVGDVAMRLGAIYLTGLCASTALSFDAYLFEQEPRRHALVIGNSEYKHIGGIPSAARDSDEVAARLTQLHFNVTHHKEVKSAQVFEDEIIPAFRRGIEPGDLVVFYFSGHGFSYGPHNFLAPTELPSQINERDLATSALAIESVEQYLARRSPGLVLSIIDACRTIGGFVITDERNRPQVAKQIVAPQQPEHGVNTLVAFASRPGFPAFGSAAANQLSVFTDSLVHHIDAEGCEFNSLMNDVGADVKVATGETQQPGLFDWSDTDVYMRPSAAVLSDHLQMWKIALDSRVRSRVEVYSIRYSLSRYAAAARKWLADNQRGTASQPFSRVSPEAVERAWGRDESRVAILPAGVRFAFPRSLDVSAGDTVRGLDDRALGLVPSGAKPRESQSLRLARIARALEAHTQIVSVIDQVARTEPSNAAPVATRIPQGSVITVDGIEQVESDERWLRAEVRGSEEKVYIPVQAARKVEPVELGRSLMEIVVPPRAAGTRDLIEESVIFSVVKKLKDAGLTITWVSIATATPKNEEARDVNAIRRFHAEDVLSRAGIDRIRITAVADANNLADDGVRLRFFGF